MVTCIFRGLENWQGWLGGFQWGVNRKGKIWSQALFAGGGSTDKDLRLEHRKFTVPEDSQGEMSSRHLEMIIR